MKLYLDPDNATGNYSYATFEESRGAPLLINRKLFYLIIPVINQGIYDLLSFNNGSQTPIYFDRSYYFFKGVKEFNEHIAIREDKTIKGRFHNHFLSQLDTRDNYDYRVNLEMGYNGTFYYAGNWKVKAMEFGVLIDESSGQSEDEQKFFKNEENLNTQDKEFLLNKKSVAIRQVYKFAGLKLPTTVCL
jgi:hypothetical protein